jgi:hypothetical protein
VLSAAALARDCTKLRGSAVRNDAGLFLQLAVNKVLALGQEGFAILLYAGLIIITD